MQYFENAQQSLDPMTKQPTGNEMNFSDVYAEVNSYFNHDFKCRKVTKHFAFNVPGVKVPQTCEYLQVFQSTFKYLTKFLRFK